MCSIKILSSTKLVLIKGSDLTAFQSFLFSLKLIFINFKEVINPLKLKVMSLPKTRTARNKLRAKIRELETNVPYDTKLLFMRTQLCILEKLLKKAARWGRRRKDWLDRIVFIFMSSFLNALEGRYATDEKDLVNGRGAHKKWKEVFQEAEFNTALARAISEAANPQPVPDSINLNTAYYMMQVHIKIDLQTALIMEGVGTDKDWQTIGECVAKCEDQFVDNFFQTLSWIGGVFWDEYDAVDLRNHIRKQVKGMFLIGEFKGLRALLGV